MALIINIRNHVKNSRMDQRKDRKEETKIEQIFISTKQR